MKRIYSALKVFWIIIVSVLIVETFLMSVVHFNGMDIMTSETHRIFALIDGILLCLILTPLLLRYVYFPLKGNIEELDKTKNGLEKTIAELKAARAEVKELRGIIPICTTCKKIRDDKGLWQQLEAYLHEHSDADFSHTMCYDCAESFYKELEKHYNVQKND